MTSNLFSTSITYFVKCIYHEDEISIKKYHLLVLDRHNSYIMLQLAMFVYSISLDVVILPFYTSHFLEPWNILIFKPFKQFFGYYKHYWILHNLNRIATKDVLA
uniref:DDE-1 domain-containing protein n=1 Tax=Physcomitrium patens TaxID=3218 RepID=A0A7I3ZQZ6_PHYPA